MITYLNPFLGAIVGTASVPTVFIGCQIYCLDNKNGKLCVDKEKYDGNGLVAQVDPFNCIKNANSSQNVHIDAECTQSYTDDILQQIINADTSEAFYACDKGK